MATVQPFKIVRPTRDKANLVVSRSYHAYSDEELKLRLSYNPYSFLHIINPGFKFEKEISGEKRFKLVRNRYQEFKDEHFFIQEKKPAFMLYKIMTRTHTFTGIIGAVSVQDYEENIIKVHENTLEKKEELFKNYLNTVGFNAEPVLITYPDNNTLDITFSEIMKTRPEYEFSTTDRVDHHLWLINDDEITQKITAEFAKMDSLYIADGHHRSASSSLLAKDYKKNGEFIEGVSQNHFMSFLIPESNLQIFEFYRLIEDLNGLSKDEFLMDLDEHFRIENRGHHLYKPTKQHHFSMYLDGEFYSLYLRKTEYDFENTLDELDAQILYNLILKPILNIVDLRNNKRIDYLSGTKDVMQLKETVDSGKFKVAFGMLPITVTKMKQIADEGLKMPPKSTYIRPKLRSGLTIYEF